MLQTETHHVKEYIIVTIQHPLRDTPNWNRKDSEAEPYASGHNEPFSSPQGASGTVQQIPVTT